LAAPRPAAAMGADITSDDSRRGGPPLGRKVCPRWWLQSPAHREGPRLRSAFRKYRIPAGRSRRNLAVLRRCRGSRPVGWLQARRCCTCGRRRRLGRSWRLPPRFRHEAEAAVRKEGRALGTEARDILWYCEPCWLAWRASSNAWFLAQSRETWDPVFGDSAEAADDEEGQYFDFIEVGTSSYHTFTQAVIEHPDGKPMAWAFLPWDKHPLQIRGLAVDMQRRYLDKLPDLPCVEKVQAAISERTRCQPMYHVMLGDVERWEARFARAGRWQNFRIIRLARGCSSLRSHPSLRRALKTVGLQHLGCLKNVKTFSMASLLARCRVKGIGVLALDCEGHDCAILRGLVRACKKRPEWLPSWIWFESNGMNDEISGKGTERETVRELQDAGYEIWWGGGYQDTGQRDTVLHLPRGRRPSAANSSYD